jgi:hypothetical protein
MDLIYKVYTYLIPDNLLNADYIILYNRTRRINNYDASIPTHYSNVLNMIFSDKSYRNNSLVHMQNAYEKCKNDTLFIKNNNYLNFVKNNSRYTDNNLIIKEGHSFYDIYWNETKSGINVFNYEVIASWNLGSSNYSSFKIWEYKTERSKALRDYNLDLLF